MTTAPIDRPDVRSTTEISLTHATHIVDQVNRGLDEFTRRGDVRPKSPALRDVANHLDRILSRCGYGLGILARAGVEPTAPRPVAVTASDRPPAGGAEQAAGAVPVVSLGQGEFKREIHAEGLVPMPEPIPDDVAEHEHCPTAPPAIDPFIVAECMEREGGSFVSTLGLAWMKADDENRRRIRRTWPEYWADYENRVRVRDKRNAALDAEHAANGKAVG